ncbi:MAG: LysM peptidoglycan-binding domain-containing protein [Verrucomicrobiales bacterium]|nr:LysM peptidoglycan-binding domain-containing protein [Verrucomicrobiales bacterium]
MFKFFLNGPIAALALVFLVDNVQADQRYEVKRGDNLYRIGLKFGISWEEIMSANRMKNSVIYPNQVLVIPNRKVAQRSRVQAPQAPVARTYAGSAPRHTSGSYRDSTVPRDPVKPFVSAKPLPSASPLPNEEDPLGLGYNPNSRSRPAPVRAIPVEEPTAIARRVPSTSPYRGTATPVTPQEPQIARAPVLRSFPRSREVPAAAHYPGRSSGPALDPIHFPTPSFENPCKPSKRSTSSGSSMKSYTVQSGDSVWSISRKFGVAPLKLRTTNNILFSRIRPGMSLKIPQSSGIWPL